MDWEGLGRLFGGAMSGAWTSFCGFMGILFVFAPHFERPVNILDRFVRHEMVTLTHELRLREKEIAKLGERICAADRLNEELRASASWRLTEPLRQVSVGLGALHRRLADLGR